MFFIFCCFVWPEVKSKGLGNVLRPWNTTFWVRKARHVVGFFVAVVGLGCARTGEGLNFFLFSCSEASAHIHADHQWLTAPCACNYSDNVTWVFFAPLASVRSWMSVEPTAP